MKNEPARNTNWAKGLSLVELLIAIGIMGVTMVLIGAAFPAGVAMSVAVSDETTSQAVFQKAVAEIKDKLSSSAVGSGANLVNMSAVFNDESRTLTANNTFSWSAMVRRMATTGPMGNLCQVVVVVSRQKPVYDASNNLALPDLKSVNCTGSKPEDRTLDIADESVPHGGYIIDETTGTAYIIVSRENNKVTTLSTPPSGASGNFWVIPGPAGNPKNSPSIRVFQAMLYLP